MPIDLRSPSSDPLRAAPDQDQGWQCVTLREERRIEEAPQAYKPIGPVIEAQEQAGLTQELFAGFATVYLELSRTAAAGRSPAETDAEARLEDVLADLDEPVGS